MTITLTREEAQQVLDALKWFEQRFASTHLELIETLRARLAQPEPKDDGHCQACDGDHCTAKTGCVALSNPPERNEPEPVAHLWECLGRWSAMLASDGEHADLSPPSWLCDAIEKAIAPPQREWQGLTDEEMFDCLAQTDGEAKRLPLGFKWFAEAIEAKLKEKNT